MRAAQTQIIDVTPLLFASPLPFELKIAHLAVSLLKRWLAGTHQGAVSHPHLDYYLDEFTFRFNRRRADHRGLLFFRLLQNAMEIEPTTYRQMVKGVRGPKPRKHKV